MSSIKGASSFLPEQGFGTDEVFFHMYVWIYFLVSFHLLDFHLHVLLETMTSPRHRALPLTWL